MSADLFKLSGSLIVDGHNLLARQFAQLADGGAKFLDRCPHQIRYLVAGVMEILEPAALQTTRIIESNETGERPDRIQVPPLVGLPRDPLGA